MFVNHVQHLLIRYLVSHAQAMCSIKANVLIVTPSGTKMHAITATALFFLKILVLIVLQPIESTVKGALDTFLILRSENVSNAH